MKTCSIGDCEKRHVARGFCSTHWARWRKHGDPLGGNERFSTPEEAFLARTEPIVGDPGCIIWTGTTDRNGYGQLRVNGRAVLAHRYAWEREHGPVPDGLYVDHACWEPSCVNTEHLRLATPQQNSAYLSGAHRDRKHDLPRGVYRDRRRYRAQVRHEGTLHYLGMFDTPEAASIAAQNKRALLYGEFAGRA